MDLGAPIGNTAPTRGFDQGEHGAGVGLSGGHGEANASNTQAGKFAQGEQSGFNHGVGGQHASGGIPSGTPIADKFSGSNNTPDVYGSTGSHSHSHQHGATGTGVGAKLDNALDEYSGHGSHSHSHGTHGVSGGDAVSGAYEGGGTRDALTGQSGHTTGAGVGVGGENLSGGHPGSHPHGPRDAALAGTAAGAGALAGSEFGSSHHHQHGSLGAAATSTAPLDRGQGLAGVGGGLQPGIGGETGSGVGPGASSGQFATGDSSRSGGLAAGAAGLGAGAGAAGASGLSGSRSGAEAGSGAHSTGGPESSATRAGVASNPTSGSGGAGKYGRAEAHDGQGQPLTKPKDLDTGNAHSLVFDKATGEYVHRRDLEGGSTTHRH